MPDQERLKELKEQMEDFALKRNELVAESVTMPRWVWEALDAEAANLQLSRGELLRVWLYERLKE